VARLVEDTVALSIEDLKSSGVFAEPDARVEREVPLSDDCSALLTIGPQRGERRDLEVLIRYSGGRTIEQRCALVLYVTPIGSRRWFFECAHPVDPDRVARRVRRLFIDDQRLRLGCRWCLGLQYQSAQQHDRRVDQAWRDPRGFQLERSRYQTLRGWRVTSTIAARANLRMGRMTEKGARRGRSWGRRSMTTWRRAQEELAAQYERKRGGPLTGSGLG
jgi:hypothetical protein